MPAATRPWTTATSGKSARSSIVGSESSLNAEPNGPRNRTEMFGSIALVAPTRSQSRPGSGGKGGSVAPPGSCRTATPSIDENAINDGSISKPASASRPSSGSPGLGSGLPGAHLVREAAREGVADLHAARCAEQAAVAGQRRHDAFELEDQRHRRSGNAGAEQPKRRASRTSDSIARTWRFRLLRGKHARARAALVTCPCGRMCLASMHCEIVPTLRRSLPCAELASRPWDLRGSARFGRGRGQRWWSRARSAVRLDRAT